MRIKNVLAGVLIVLVVYLFTPVGAQTIVRLYGTVSGAPIALLATSGGLLRVSVDGGVTPTYPLSIAASTCAAPNLGETGAVTTGIAFTATPSILNCITGTAVTTLTATTFTNTVPFLASDGSSAAPSLSFTSRPQVGFYLTGAADNRIGVSLGNNLLMRFDGGRTILASSQDLSWADNTPVSGATNSLSLRWFATSKLILTGPSTGIGFDVSTDAVVKVRDTVHSAYGTVDLLNMQLSGNTALRSGTPTVTGAGSTCGTSAPAIVGNNSFGKVTTGSVAPTSCVVTFSSTWTTAPACIAANETTSNLLRATSTATTLTMAGTMVAGDVLVFVCGGYVP